MLYFFYLGDGSFNHIYGTSAALSSPYCTVGHHTWVLDSITSLATGDIRYINTVRSLSLDVFGVIKKRIKRDNILPFDEIFIFYFILFGIKQIWSGSEQFVERRESYSNYLKCTRN